MCKVLIFLHPHTHHKRSSASNLWCPIPGWQQWWQGQLQSHNLLSSTYGRRAESWKASSSTSNCCCYCCCCCCCWGSRCRGDNHQYCYRASDKLQQVAVAPMNHSKTTFYFQNASWREGDRKLILRHSCCCRRRRWFWAGTNSEFSLNEFYTLLKSHKRIDSYDISVCHWLSSAHYINNTRRHISKLLHLWTFVKKNKTITCWFPRDVKAFRKLSYSLCGYISKQISWPIE